MASLHRRIASGTAASAASVALLALAQIASVPILTSAWGLEGYGIWAMLTTIPSYLALSDLGFASAATSKMAAQFARKELEQLKCTFQSVWLLNGSLAGLIIVIAVMAIWSLQSYFSTIRDEKIAVFLLVIYSTLVMNARVWLGAFRAAHNYALGTLLYDGWLPLETLITLLVVHLGGDLVSAVAVLVSMRAASTILMWIALRNRLPWLDPGVRAASLDEIRRLAAPAFGAIAIPAALALNLQGGLLLAGFAISPAAAATLAAVRTVSRAALQIVGVINRATMPELAAAWALKRADLFRRIVVINLGSAATILIPASVIFAIFGKTIIEKWTHGTIDASADFILLMALSFPLHGYWFFALNLLLASNQHTKVSLQLAALAAAVLFPAFVMAKLFGLNGLATALLGLETISSVLVTNCFRKAYSGSKAIGIDDSAIFEKCLPMSLCEQRSSAGTPTREQQVL